MSLKNAKASTKTSATGGRAGCPGQRSQCVQRGPKLVTPSCWRWTCGGHGGWERIPNVCHGSLNVPMGHITQPLGIWSIMATIRWCPIFPKWDSYQPLFVSLEPVDSTARSEHPQMWLCWGRWPTSSCQCRSSFPWRAPGMSLARGRCQGTCCGGAAVVGSPGSCGRGGLWGKGSAALGGEQRSCGGCQGVAQGKCAGGEGGNMWKPENSPVEGSQIKVWVLPCFANQDGTRSGVAKEIGVGPHLYLGWLFKGGSTQPFLEVLINTNKQTPWCQ